MRTTLLLPLALATAAAGCQLAPSTPQTPALQDADAVGHTARRAMDALIPAALADGSLGDPAALPDVAERTVEAVVNIQARKPVSMRGMRLPFGLPIPDALPEQEGTGSGVLVDPEGVLLTNHHVVADASSLEITLSDGRTFGGEVVGSDPATDLAVVRLTGDVPDDLPVVELADSERLRLGEVVLAVGSPFGLRGTVTMGIVSGLGRRMGLADYEDYIQTDAAINRGNSGGALVNLRGEVVGINTWIASQSGGSIGLGFAIPVNNARSAIDQMIASGRVEYGWLGVNMADPPTSPSNSLGEDRGGAFVYSVYEDSPAAQSGLAPGDIITAVDSTPVRTGNDLLRAVTNLQPGTRSRFTVLREGETQTLTVRMGARPDDEDAVDTAALWPGMSVVEITDSIRSNMNLSPRDGNVIVGQVAAGSPAAAAGLRSGDIVLRVNNSDVDTLRDFYRELNGARGEVLFRIRRSDTTLILGLVKE